MNLPNKLTMLRMALIPFFLVFMVFYELPYNYLWALLLFAGASITDYLDGNIARKRGLVTNFGKFMDPLADKLLTMAAFVCFTRMPNEVLEMPVVVLVFILAREFAVTALRTLAADNGIALAADKWGKIKTVCQMVWICYVLLIFAWAYNFGHSIVGVHYLIYWVGLALVLVATVGSGINYLWKNRQLFLSSK